MRRLVFDVETDGLLKELTKVHCIAAHDVDTGERWDWGPDGVEEGVRFLMAAGVLIGHNIVNFDVRALRKLFPWFKIKEECRLLDTLILCKLIWPVDVLIGRDMALFHKGVLPGKYIKRQSLAAWGFRLGEFKQEYDGGWEQWSQEMQDYLKQDVVANTALWKRCEERLGWTEAAAEKGTYVWPTLPIWIEHEAMAILSDQEDAGVGFDSEKAVNLLGHLTDLQMHLGDKLKAVFGQWWQPLDNPRTGRKAARDMTRKLTEFPDVTIPRFGKKGQPLKPYVGPPLEHYTKGVPYTRIVRVTFSPSSRQHLADRLQRVFGWQPTEFTDNKRNPQPQIDEVAIRAIPSSVIDEETRGAVLDYFIVSKTLGMLSSGNKSWMHYVQEDGRIRHICDQLGTITTRAAHRNPNLGQVPAVEVDEEKDSAGKVVKKTPVLGLKGGYGFECRDLFTAGREGWEMTGTDMSSLEFILLGHDLHPLDGGTFSERVCDPERDPHQEHAALTGLSRRDTKTTGYAYIFGAGDAKIGFGVGFTEEEIPELLRSKSLAGKLRWKRKMLGATYEEPNERTKAAISKGAVVKKRFEEAITGLKDLKKNMGEIAKERGWIKSITGGKLTIRKPHATLNARLQGGGAGACKLWMILLNKKLKERGLIWGRDYMQMLFVHDELQFGHRKGLGGAIAEASQEAAKETGRILGLHGEFRTESKTGTSWAATH